MSRKLVILNGHRFAGACDPPTHGEISPCTNGRGIDMGKIRRARSKEVREYERRVRESIMRGYEAIR